MKFTALVLRLMVGVMVVALLMGCTTATPPVVPTTAPQPTVDVQPTLVAVQTQAAQTVVADLTKNAPTKPANTVAPSATTAPTTAPTTAATVAPTKAPTAAPTTVAATATSVPTTKPTAGAVLWTLTPTLSTYNCVNLSVSPLKTETLAPYQDFDGRWEVLNSGSEMWTNSDLDIRYISGVRLQKKIIEEVPFTVSVLHNEKYTVLVDMRAPADPGVYSTNWAIMKGNRAICNLNLTITVK